MHPQMATNITHFIEVTDDPATAADRDTIGGAPHLPPDIEHPRCKLCNERMVLFLQFDVRKEFGLPFQPGSHFSAFMCPQHNDATISAEPLSELPMSPRYWEQDLGHFSILLLAATAQTVAGQLDRHIQSRKLRFEQTEEQIETGEGITSGSQAFKVGGVPYWINYAPQPKCSCGGTLRFVCQLPENLGFPKIATAPSQPNSFSYNDYCYLLGNFVYFLACDQQCDAQAAVAICDN